MKFVKSFGAFFFALVLSTMAFNFYYANDRAAMRMTVLRFHQAVVDDNDDTIKRILTEDFTETGYWPGAPDSHVVTRDDYLKSTLWQDANHHSFGMSFPLISNFLNSSGDSLSFYELLSSSAEDDACYNSPLTSPVTYTFVKGPRGFRIKHIRRHAMLPINGL